MKRLNNSYPYVKQAKNRSSKDLGWLTGPGTKPIMRCVSNEQLQNWANREVKGAYPEIQRRNAKSDKKESK